MATITPLLSAARLSLPLLPTLCSDHELVTTMITDMLERARAGDDLDGLDGELLALVDQRAEVRRLLRELVVHPRSFRSAGGALRDGNFTPTPVATDAVPMPEGPAGTTERQSAERHVNAFVSAGNEEPWERALTPGDEYAVLVHVGVPLPQSLLDPTDSVLDLPEPEGDGTWLRAVLDLGIASSPVVASLFVTDNGESFSCSCGYGQPHGAGCERAPWAKLPFRTPGSAGNVRCTLVVYREAVALHVQEVTLPVGTSGAPTSRLISQVTSSFRDLADLEGRSASVVLSEGSSRVTVNGLGFTSSPFSLTAGKSDTAVLSVRGMLRDAHLRVIEHQDVNRYDENLSKPHEDFIHDLALLAQVGSQIYSSIFDPSGPDDTTPWSLPALLRHEALTRGQPPLLQVADPNYSDASVVWQAIYDMPLGSDPSAYVLCPSLTQFEKLPNPPTPLCPYDEQHRGHPDVLCAWGFWGLSTLLEQPAGRPSGALQRRRKPMTCVVVRGPRLAPLDQEHLDRLQNLLGSGSVRTARIGAPTDLAADLADDPLDVAYFYCHCGYREGAIGAGVERYLDLGEYSLSAQDFVSWARSSDIWARDHWRQSPPLVVLNGCHTTEFSTRTLGGFVPALTTWAQAAGVVGTEITVHQSIANWVGESLLHRLWAGEAVSTALRDLRWQLLRRGNLMGLAYTAYCRGDLAFTS